MAVLLGTSVFIFPACCKDHDDDAPGYCSEEGIITGIDLRACACCGGWFIEIGGDTLRANDLSQQFKEDLSPYEFPLSVYLEWSPDETPCLGDEIEVSCIRRRE